MQRIAIESVNLIARLNSGFYDCCTHSRPVHTAELWCTHSITTLHKYKPLLCLSQLECQVGLGNGSAHHFQVVFELVFMSLSEVSYEVICTLGFC